MLRERQYQILKFIHEHTSEYGYVPTIREICRALEINSTSVVNYNLERLVCLGYLIRTPAKARAFALTGSARELFEDHYVTDTHKLREEIRLLRVENDRIRQEYQKQITTLRHEIKHLSQELHHPQPFRELHSA